MQLYPKGFLLTKNHNKVPENYLKCEIDFLYHSPDCLKDYSAYKDAEVMILGFVVTTEDFDGKDNAQDLATSLHKSEDAFFNKVDQLCGRFTIIFKRRNILKIMSDATSMRSIFYNKDITEIASHAEMIAVGSKLNVSFRYGFPGNGTPYEGIRLLTANCLINVCNKTVDRFWPREIISTIDVEAAEAIVVEKTVNAIQNAARKSSLKLALTAGLDSRTMLALMLKSNVSFETYTYGRASDTAIDRAVAADISSKLDVVHNHIVTKSPTSQMKDLYDKNSYLSSHRSAIGPLQEWFSDSGGIAVTANLLEIGRNFYKFLKQKTYPVDAAGMRELYLLTMPRPDREEVLKNDSLMLLYFNLFEDFLRLSNFNSARQYGLSSFDQFYWEHRMSAWHGLIINERDYYAEAFIPFNSRVVLEATLGVEERLRSEAYIFKSIINDSGVGADFMPINPKVYAQSI